MPTQRPYGCLTVVTVGLGDRKAILSDAKGDRPVEAREDGTNLFAVLDVLGDEDWIVGPPVWIRLD